MYGSSVSCIYRVARLCSIRFYSNKSSKKLLDILAGMPKVNSPRIAEAQRQRQNITKKSDKYAPSTVYLQVIGSGARGAPNTLYLFTDQKRYLFNCGECTQRLAHEHKVKLSRLDHIFITSKTWRNIGGLPGLSLTLQDVGVPNITLHGPEGLDELYHATRRFVIMKDMNVTMAKCTHSEDFEDNALTVKYVLLGPHNSLLTQDKPFAKRPKLDNTAKEFEEFFHDETDYYNPAFSKNKDVKEKLKSKTIESEKDKATKKSDKVLHNLQKMSHCTVAYICTLKKRLGTLDLAKCVELGVKPGPMLGQLKSGQDVMLPDGTIVLSKDVKTPDDPGPVFIVIEVPELTYLKEMEFSAHFDNGKNPPENIPTLVVHYTPPHVFNHPVYRAFMAMFGKKTRHMALNSQNVCLGSEAVHRTQHKLNLLDSDIFPLLKDASVPAVWNSSPAPTNDSPIRKGLEDLKNKIAFAQFQNIIHTEGNKGDGQATKEEEDKTKFEVLTARTLTMFHLRPKRQVDRSAEPKLHIQDYIQEPMNVDGFVGSLEQFRRLVENIRYMRIASTVKEYPKVVFLGTGSCIPSKTRNTSGIALQIDEDRSMLMDCSEGTFGQLVRFFGPKKVNTFLRSLKAIYVSHLHADHHIGLVGVLQARREAFEQAELEPAPVILLAPGQIITWLSIYDQQFERIKPDYTLIPNQNLVEEHSAGQAGSGDLTSAVLANIGVQNIRTCLVSHCPNAFGLAVDIDGVHKVTYSGDTIPCEALMRIGRDSTLLIHEATMEDELAEEARIKMHSTTTQAIEVGRQMNAKYTLLTHFSQRYARLPRLNANILNDNKTVGIAFDNMQISMNDLELLPHMYAPLQLMFAEHCVEMELKAQHRARHKERQEQRSLSPRSENVLSTRGCLPRDRRNVSPGCHAKYRETNASRLRQELKGMTISEIGRKEPRSKSFSPIKRSTNSSPTHSINGDSAVLPRRQNSERTIELNSASRTISETSNCSRDGANFTVTSNLPAPCGYILDTRSKTLQSINPINTPTTQHPNTPNAEKETKVTKKNIAPDSSTRGTSLSGYGRPLVTPMNKKLMIRRDFDLKPQTTANHFNNVKLPLLHNGKSTMRTYEVNSKPPFNTSPKYTDILMKPQLLSNLRVDTVTSVLIHIIIWRLAHIASCLSVKMWPCVIALIALGIVFWTATKGTTSANSLRSHIPTNARREDASLGLKNKVDGKQQRPNSATVNRTSKSPVKQMHPQRVAGKPLNSTNPAYRNKMKLMKSVQQPGKSFPGQGGQVAHVSPTRSSATKIPKNICSENSINGAPLRNFSTEKLKQQFCRDTSVYAAGRPNAVHSATRAFKPQLEDIKSSFVLLNKKQQEHAKKMNAVPDNDKTRLDYHQQRIYDENMRKQQLNQIKKWYQSKKFYDESKYDKIEGLNWITWNY